MMLTRPMVKVDFGGAMKFMFKESDMKKEFHTYILPNLGVGQHANVEDRSEECRPQEISNINSTGTEVAVKLIGIHESFGQTAEKLVVHRGRQTCQEEVVEIIGQCFFPNANRSTKVLELVLGLALRILASKLDAWPQGREESQNTSCCD